MYFPKPLLCLVLAPLLVSCSGSTKTPAHDASAGHDLVLLNDAGLEAAPLPQDSAGDLRTDVLHDAGLEAAPLPRDSAGDLGTDVPVDAGSDALLPQDSSTAGDLGTDISELDAGDADTAKACFWQTPGGRYTLSHFSFLLTTPDGQEQFPPSGLAVGDAGSKPNNDFEGRLVSVDGNRFTVDGCLSPSSCQPSLYRFVLCSALQSACRLDASHSSVQIAIPSGRLVRVVWHMDMDAPGFSPGLFWLAIYDAEPSATEGNLLFLGSGGYKPGYAGGPTIDHLAELPFSVGLQPLNCGGLARDALPLGDDYAFVFAPKNGQGATLQVATGEAGSFEFTAESGLAQRLQVHCLDAVQPSSTDDYWNWDFWAASETVLGPPQESSDAGGP